MNNSSDIVYRDMKHAAQSWEPGSAQRLDDDEARALALNTGTDDLVARASQLRDMGHGDVL